MLLSWKEIKTQATRIPEERENETSEDAEAKTSLAEFIQICRHFMATGCPSFIIGQKSLTNNKS